MSQAELYSIAGFLIIKCIKDIYFMGQNIQSCAFSSLNKQWTLWCHTLETVVERRLLKSLVCCSNCSTLLCTSLMKCLSVLTKKCFIYRLLQTVSTFVLNSVWGKRTRGILKISPLVSKLTFFTSTKSCHANKWTKKYKLISFHFIFLSCFRYSLILISWTVCICFVLRPNRNALQNPSLLASGNF